MEHLTPEDAKAQRRSVRFTGGSPWGGVQGAREFAPGVVLVSTASHGGFKLDEERNRLVPAPLRASGGWYEEDCEWACVAYAFPHLFTAAEYRDAVRSLKDWKPAEYMAASGETVSPEESYWLRKLAAAEANADRFVVVSALTAGPGIVYTLACKGGRDPQSGNYRGELVAFEVDAAEYREGNMASENGFVIDEARHKRLEDVTPANWMQKADARLAGRAAA